MNEIKIFESEQFGKIRTSMTESGEPLFCLADICKVLNLQTNKVKARLSMRGWYTIPTPTYNQHGTMVEQQMTFITEPNLYKCIFQSRKKEAEAFQDWVCEEVLPSIRKTGAYGMPKSFGEALMIAAKQQLQIEEQQKQLEANATEIITLNDKVSEMEPKAVYYDQILKSTNTLLVTQIAKDYGYSARSFNKLLEELHIQYKLRGQWILYAEHAGKGYTKSTSVSIPYNDGTYGSKLQTEWTQKGRLFLYETLKANDVLPLIEQ